MDVQLVKLGLPKKTWADLNSQGLKAQEFSTKGHMPT